MSRDTISVAEVLTALAEAMPAQGEDVPPHTYSGTEIRAGLRWGHARFERAMREWLADGTCRLVTVRKYALDGRLACVRGYQFTPPTAKRKRAA
jgi:hypothetical protein